MKITLKLPRYGMNMEEATLIKWLKKPGDKISEGDGIYEIETEKVTQVVEASGNGTFVEALVEEGEDVAVGAGVCVVETGG